MRKTFIVIVLSLFVLTGVFAEENGNGREGFKLGAKASLFTQGIDMEYDFGRWEAGASLSFPLVNAGFALFSSDCDIADLWQVLLMDELKLHGYYSVVDRQHFTFNAGLVLSTVNTTFFTDVEDKPDRKPYGGAVLTMLTPSIEIEFRFGGSAEFFICLDSPLATMVTKGSSSDDILPGIGTGFAYGDTLSLAFALVTDIVVLAKDFATFGVTFRI